MIKVCLINPPDLVVEDPCWDDPLGLLYLGAVLEKLATVELVDLNFHKDWKTELVKHEADVYGVYCSSSLLNSVIAVSRLLRTVFPEALTMVGGPHATCVPEQMIEYFDRVVIGEGETAILGIFNPLHRKIVQCPPINDLDSIPLPARYLVSKYKYHRKVGGLPATGLITSRGCPFQCIFCSKVWGKTTRFRSAHNVIDEVRECVDKYGIRGFSMRDDTFTLNRPRLMEILKGLKALDVKWRCITRVDQVNELTLKNMKNSGCVEIVYGIESGSQEILDNLGKGTTVEQNARAIDLTVEAGISCKAAVIVGSPGETWETVDATIRLIEKHIPDSGIVCVFTPYPGSYAWQDPDKYKIKILSRDVTKYQIVGPGMHGNVVVETEEMNARDIAEAHEMVLTRFRQLGLVP